MLGLPSCGRVYCDGDVDVDMDGYEEMRIAVWKGLDGDDRLTSVY